MADRLTQIQAEDRYKLVDLELIDQYVNVFKKCKTLCKCGHIWYSIPNDIFAGKTKRCKECAKYSRSINKSTIKVGDKFGRLIVIEKDWSLDNSPDRCGRPFWIVLCKCGRKTKVFGTALLAGLTKSCGNCRLFRNGRRISLIQLKLHKMIDRGVVNFLSDPYAIDIAFVSNGVKIGIEYDSWKYHQNRLDQDIIKIENLVKRGWKILSIKSGWLLPEIGYINYCLNELINGNSNYQEIILQDWGK